MLGSFVLALDDDARRKVGDPHRRFHLVDVLTARAAGPVPFQVQDEAAQLVTLLAAGELRGRRARVLDACAAPGGKSFHLLELLGPGAEVVAIELHPRKADELRREAERRGLSGLRVVCAAAFVPARSRDHGRDHLAGLASRVRAALDEVLPFLGHQPVHESVPMLSAPSERRGSRLMAHPLYEVRLSQALGVTGLPTQSPLENLVFAGREVLPGLGIEGEFHAALQAAARVQRILGRKDTLR